MVRGKGHTHHNATVAAKGIAESDRSRTNLGSVRGIPDGLEIRLTNFPDFDGVVPAGRGEPAAIRAEGNRGDLICVPRERDTVRGHHGVTGQRAGVPEADGVIVASRYNLVAVGTEGRAGDGAVMSVDRQ